MTGALIVMVPLNVACLPEDPCWIVLADSTTTLFFNVWSFQTFSLPPRMYTLPLDGVLPSELLVVIAVNCPSSMLMSPPAELSNVLTANWSPDGVLKRNVCPCAWTTSTSIRFTVQTSRSPVM